MDILKIRSITNNYQDVRLLSLKDWPRATAFENRDYGGPYVIVQEGYDPQDPKMDVTEFMLGKSGEWVTMRVFYRLPRDVRHQEFIYARAAEVIALFENLMGDPKIVRKGTEQVASSVPTEEPEHDDLNAAVTAAKQGNPGQNQA